MASTPTFDLVRDSQLQVHFSDRFTFHNRLGTTEKWSQDKFLGQGAFGLVRLQRRSSDGELRAVKMVRKRPSRHSSQIDFTHELLAMAKFSQPKYTDYFVQSFGWYEDSEHVFITMEYIELGDLESVSNQPLPEPEVKQITGQLLQGLVHMHSNGFTHRDVKPENIFVVSKGPNWWVKIGDFGVSKRVQATTALYTIIGTPRYMAPELRQFMAGFRHEVSLNYTSAVDMWSLGVVVCRLRTGQMPSDERGASNPSMNSPARSPSQALLSNFRGHEIHQFLKGLLAENPEHRVSASEALEHDWLKSLNDEMPELPSQERCQTFADHCPSQTPDPATSLEASANWSSLDETIVQRQMYRPQQSQGAVEPTRPNGTTLDTCNNLLCEKRLLGTRSPDQTIIQRAATPTSDTFSSILSDTKQASRTVCGTAHLLYSQEKYDEVEVEISLALERQSKSLGPEHSDTLSSVYWLGMALFFKAKYSEAGKRFQQAIEGQSKNLGRDHVATLDAIYWLGRSFYGLQNHREAEQKFQQTMTGQEKLLGHEHVDTLYSIFWLGRSLHDQGKYGEAQTLFWKAMQGLETSLGREHADTLNSRYWLGRCMYGQKDYRVAEMRFQEAMEGQEKILGHEHLDTLHSTLWLGCSLFDQESYRKAETLLRKAVNGLMKSLGDEHKDSLTATYWLGRCMYCQKEYEEAGSWLSQAVDGFKNTMGDDHELTQTVNRFHTKCMLKGRVSTLASYLPRPRLGFWAARKAIPVGSRSLVLGIRAGLPLLVTASKATAIAAIHYGSMVALNLPSDALRDRVKVEELQRGGNNVSGPTSSNAQFLR